MEREAKTKIFGAPKIEFFLLSDNEMIDDQIFCKVTLVEVVEAREVIN